MSKYSRQKIDYWTNYILENGGVNLLDQLGERDIRKGAGKFYKGMPESFFESLPTGYARGKVYDRVTERIKEFQQALDAPDSMPRGQLMKRIDRLERVQRASNKGKPLINRQKGMQPKKGYLTLDTFSSNEVVNILQTIAEGLASSAMFRVQGRKPGVYVDFGQETDLVLAEMNNVYQEIKAGETDRINEEYQSDLIENKKPPYYFLDFQVYYPGGKDAGERPIWITAIPRPTDHEEPSED